VQQGIIDPPESYIVCEFRVVLMPELLTQQGGII
jgi:hypothetical protein